jgi:hypothetical protein
MLSNPMSVIKVIVVTKDEYDLIDDFIRYYGYIFGINNIVIVDNGSTHPDVLAIYQKYQGAGLTIVHESRPFQEATVFMTEHIHNLIANCPDTEWVVCAETDEFLFWSDDVENEGAITSPQTIDNYLQNVPNDISILRYEKVWCSIVNPEKLGSNYANGICIQPTQSLVEFYDQTWDKIIVRAKTFVSIAQWLHSCNVSHGSMVICKELSLVHFHNTGKRRLFERACKVLESIGVCQNIEESFINSPETVIQCISTFHATQCSHGHKAGYVLDVLVRSFCWCFFQQLHNKQPTKSFVTAATQSKDMDIMTTMIKEWKDVGDGDSFTDCVYVEDDINVQLRVYSIKNTLRYLDGTYL